MDNAQQAPRRRLFHDAAGREISSTAEIMAGVVDIDEGNCLSTSQFFELGMTIAEVATISRHRNATMLFRYAHANALAVFEKLDPAPFRTDLHMS
jgi:hypothetical protein